MSLGPDLEGRGFDEDSARSMREWLRLDAIVKQRYKELVQRYSELNFRISYASCGYTHDSPNPAAREEPDYPRMNDGCYWRRAGSRHNKCVGDWGYLL